ncbi:MAG TPA: hypothetical protein VGR70_07105 [Stellaceae bacterium]|nr:hypothetical protein [Stellaceae bacterium]
MSLFDTYIIVDWSASNVPKRGKDSIWACRQGDAPINLATRSEAKSYLEALLSDGIGKGERILVGFDFPFGYPAGFAKRLRLAGEPWRSTWKFISDRITDGPKNGNNRFEIGAQLNERVSGGRFPFWGCPPKTPEEVLKFLGPRRNHPDSEPLRERRLIDQWMVGAQPCWKLAYTGSVGSQVLTGIPVVRALRDDKRWEHCARVWPFETGLTLPAEARIVFAEVWPSWWKWKETREEGEIADRAQVRHVAGVFAQRDREGQLDAWFTPPVPSECINDVVSEEAWTLGVVAPRLRKARGTA